MERHTTLNDDLNRSCEKSKLTSWTKHINHRGTVYTIRFSDKEAILDPRDQENLSNVNSIIYKPKSRYHIIRDHSRLKKINKSSLPSHSFENDISFDTQLGSEIHHSEPVSFACDHHNRQVYNNDFTESVSFRLTDCPKPLDEQCHSSLPSIEKNMFTADLQECPPVLFKSLESHQYIQPLVEISPTVIVTPPVELNMPICNSQPILEPVEPSYLPIKHDVIILPRDPEPGPKPLSLTPINQPKHEQQSYNFDHISPIHAKTVDTTTEGYIEKYLHSSEILCDICCATVPKDMNMLYCDSCCLHVCGNCLLTCSLDHSINCTDILRYMRNDEKHLQYVPDSNDSYTNNSVNSCNSYTNTRWFPDPNTSSINHSHSTCDTATTRELFHKEVMDALVPTFESHSVWVDSFMASIDKRVDEMKGLKQSRTHDPGGSKQ